MWLFKYFGMFSFLYIIVFPKTFLKNFDFFSRNTLSTLSLDSVLCLSTLLIFFFFTILLFYDLNLHLGWAKEARRKEFVVIAFMCWFTVLHQSYQHFEMFGSIFLLPRIIKGSYVCWWYFYFSAMIILSSGLWDVKIMCGIVRADAQIYSTQFSFQMELFITVELVPDVILCQMSVA